jgi:hypothetical protein
MHIPSSLLPKFGSETEWVLVAEASFHIDMDSTDVDESTEGVWKRSKR